METIEKSNEPDNMVAKHKFATMISETQKKRIKLYSAAERCKEKSEHRRRDAAEVEQGRAALLQEVNRALPPAAQLEFDDREDPLPTE